MKMIYLLFISILIFGLASCATNEVSSGRFTYLEDQAERYQKTKNYEKAMEIWRRLAVRGVASAERNLGINYYFGLGVHRNFTIAVEWFVKAAEKDDSGAQYYLGANYFHGLDYKNAQGIRQDYEKALYWFNKSAAQGDILGEFGLGVMYVFGLAVDYNEELAIKYFTSSAEKGFAYAMHNLGNIYFDRNDQESDDLAVQWYIKAIENNVTQPEMNLALMEYLERGDIPSSYRVNPAHRNIKMGFLKPEVVSNDPNDFDSMNIQYNQLNYN